jgi:hypothetical protein
MSIKKSGTFTVGATGANVGPAAFFTFLNVGGPTPSKFNFLSLRRRGGPLQEMGETSGVSKVFLRIARKSILFEQKTSIINRDTENIILPPLSKASAEQLSINNFPQNILV